MNDSSGEIAMTTTVNEIELEPPFQGTFSGQPLLASAWPFLGSVKVHVTVRVGGAEATVAQLLEMKHGSVLELDRFVDEPLDVLVDGHIVARGTLVAAGEHFGVRITEIASAGQAR